MMRRVLILSPRFPPVNAPDLHRVRMTAGLMRDHGWEPTVLTVDPAQIDGSKDAFLCETIPPHVSVVHAPALGLRFARIPGVGGLAVRSYRGLRAVGDKLLKRDRFDLLYVSTTEFEVLPLALHWKRRFSLPYVIDLQDPWVTNYYHDRPHIRPPGGWAKYWVMDKFARRQEPRVLGAANGWTSVSPHYPEINYPFTADMPRLVLPFPASMADFEGARRKSPRQAQFDPSDGKLHFVYVGAVGPIMAHAIEAIMIGFRDWLAAAPQLRQDVRLHFIGTSYAAAGQGIPGVVQLAAQYGLGDIVREQTDRVPYSDALQCIEDATALIVPGSDDPSYTASKIYPYLMAKKPLLVVFHADSPMVAFLDKVGGAHVVRVTQTDPPHVAGAAIHSTWLSTDAWRHVKPLDADAFAPFTASEATRRLCAFFDATVARATTTKSVSYD